MSSPHFFLRSLAALPAGWRLQNFIWAVSGGLILSHAGCHADAGRQAIVYNLEMHGARSLQLSVHVSSLSLMLLHEHGRVVVIETEGIRKARTYRTYHCVTLCGFYLSPGGNRAASRSGGWNLLGTG